MVIARAPWSLVGEPNASSKMQQVARAFLTVWSVNDIDAAAGDLRMYTTERGKPWATVHALEDAR